ncbi:MAG: O-antigen ligase C-terminal domain-containing protein [Hydrogenophilaceae bacterium]|nr:O-antigen ligase C-terminal domain-containing protein [Hydrogenophilaceae bacterium]
MRLSGKVAWAGLIGLFSVPFLIPVHSLPLTSFYTEWWAFLCGLLLFISWIFSFNSSVEIQIPRIAWFALALAALLLLHMGLGLMVYPSQGGLAILYLVWAILLMPAASALSQKYGRDNVLSILAASILVAGLINVIIGVFQAFGIHTAVTDLLFSLAPPSSAFGNIAQKNNYADYLAIALCAALYLGYSNKLSWRIVALAGLVVVFGLTLSGSRSVWLYLIAILLLALLLKARQPGPSANRLVWFSILALAAFQIFQMALPLLESGQAIATANSRLQEDAGESMPVRLALWQDAWHMFASNPWLGVGFQNHAWNHFELVRSGHSLFAGQSGYETLRWDHAHNIVLQLMAEFGLAALVLCFGAVWWLLRLIRNITSVEQWWPVAAISIISIHSLLEYPLWYANFLGLFAVLAALAEDRPISLAIPKGSLSRLGMFLSVLGFGILVFYYTTYTSLKQAMAGLVSPAPAQKFSGEFQKNFDAAQINPFLEPQVDNLMSQLPIIDPHQLTFVDLQLQLNEKIIRHRADADSIYHRTTLLWLAGYHLEAERWLAGAIAIYPGSLQRYIERTEFTFGNTEDLAPLLGMIRKQKSG